MAPQNPSLQATENAVPANVVIQPISGLSLQPTVTSSANMTIGSLSEQESVLTTSANGKHYQWFYCAFNFLILPRVLLTVRKCQPLPPPAPTKRLILIK